MACATRSRTSRAHERRPRARSHRRRLHRDRGRRHGRSDQENLRRARLRRHALCAQLFRRRGRPARVPRRRRARHGHRCCCIRSRPSCRPTAWALPTSAPCARRPSNARSTRTGSTALRRNRRSACAAGARGTRRAGSRKTADRDDARPRARALCGLGRQSRSSTAVRETPPPCGEALRARASRRASVSSIRAKALVIEAASVEAFGGGERREEPEHASGAGRTPARRTARGSSPRGKWREARVYLREHLAPGHSLAGPALIIEPNQTIVVEEGWRAEITRKDHVLLTRAAPREKRTAIGTHADPVLLEVFNNRFMSIAEQMGVTLQNTASSVNIKERLDFSCAIFDANANLVANAPHMPVHLGSMDRSVETIARENAGRIKPGDVFALNAPYNGGTHLPDITVCTPVFDTAGARILFWIAVARPSRRCRRHCAGLHVAARHDHRGGRRLHRQFPARVAMAASARRETLALLTGARYPARNPAQNIADLKAQVAANARGAALLQQMIDEFSLDVVEAYMGHVQDNAEESVRRVIARLTDSQFHRRTRSGNAHRASPSASIATRREATIDFTGTSPQQPDNFNAPEPDHARRVPLCVPRAGRRRHSHERGLPAAAEDHCAAGLDARAALARRRRRGQCRDEPERRRLPVRRAGRARLRAGHDEQSHLRQRAKPVLRNDLLGRARGRGFRRRERPCTRT